MEDYAGNSIEYTFTIDTQGPRIKDLVSGYIYNKDLPIKFTVTVLPQVLPFKVFVIFVLSVIVNLTVPLL